jgi:hypothetical protein
VTPSGDPAGAFAPVSVDFVSDRTFLPRGHHAKLTWRVTGDIVDECDVELLPEPGRFPPEHSYFVSPATDTTYTLRITRGRALLAERSVTITTDAAPETSRSRWILASVVLALVLFGIWVLLPGRPAADVITLSAKPARLSEPGNVILIPHAPRGARLQLVPESDCDLRHGYWICTVGTTTEFQLSCWRGSTLLGTASTRVEVEASDR